jgi:hypothetical protein
MNMNEDTDEREAIAILPINGYCYIHDELLATCACDPKPQERTAADVLRELRGF